MKVVISKYFFSCYSKGMLAKDFYNLRFELANIGLRLRFVNKNFSKKISLDSCNYILYSSLDNKEILGKVARVIEIFDRYEISLLGIFSQNTFFNLKNISEKSFPFLILLKNNLSIFSAIPSQNLKLFRKTLLSIKK